MNAFQCLAATELGEPSMCALDSQGRLTGLNPFLTRLPALMVLNFWSGWVEASVQYTNVRT